MSLNLGEQFKQRWLATPEPVRQTYIDELEHISHLLKPEIQVSQWQAQDTLLKKKFEQIQERTYRQLKQEMLAEQARIAEEKRRLKQQQLEYALNEKRAQQQAQNYAQQQLEQEKYKQQTLFLQQYAIILQHESLQIAQQAQPFDITKVKQFNQTVVQSTSDLKLRLELEAEQHIEETLTALRQKLRAAAQEEIALIMAQQKKDD